MAITKVNDYGIGDNNLTAFGTSIDLQRRGEGQITLSEYDTDSAPDVTIGSWFENNGTLYKIETAAETPTGYAGLTNSTTFYLYYSVSGSAFIYSNTAPTWSDSKQGWYNGNDRALFSMYKDSGGTLYQDKNLLMSQNNYEFPNKIKTTNGVVPSNVLHDTIATASDIYDQLVLSLSNVGDRIIINGAIIDGTDNMVISYAERTDLTTITLYGMDADLAKTRALTSSAATIGDVSIAW